MDAIRRIPGARIGAVVDADGAKAARIAPPPRTTTPPPSKNGSAKLDERAGGLAAEA